MDSQVSEIRNKGIDIGILSLPFSLSMYGGPDVCKRVLAILRSVPVGQRSVMFVISD